MLPGSDPWTPSKLQYVVSKQHRPLPRGARTLSPPKARATGDHDPISPDASNMAVPVGRAWPDSHLSDSSSLMPFHSQDVGVSDLDYSTLQLELDSLARTHHMELARHQLELKLSYLHRQQLGIMATLAQQKQGATPNPPTQSADNFASKNDAILMETSSQVQELLNTQKKIAAAIESKEEEAARRHAEVERRLSKMEEDFDGRAAGVVRSVLQEGAANGLGGGSADHEEGQLKNLQKQMEEMQAVHEERCRRLDAQMAAILHEQERLVQRVECLEAQLQEQPQVVKESEDKAVLKRKVEVLEEEVDRLLVYLKERHHEEDRERKHDRKMRLPSLVPISPALDPAVTAALILATVTANDSPPPPRRASSLGKDGGEGPPRLSIDSLSRPDARQPELSPPGAPLSSSDSPRANLSQHQSVASVESARRQASVEGSPVKRRAPSAKALTTKGTWEELKAPDGTTWYYNHQNRVKHYHKPEGEILAQVELDKSVKENNSPRNWERFRMEDGQTFYRNKVTRATTWERPTCLSNGTTVIKKRTFENTDWEEFEYDGRLFYRNKVTRQKEWDPPKAILPLLGDTGRRDTNRKKSVNHSSQSHDRRMSMPTVVSDVSPAGVEVTTGQPPNTLTLSD